MDTGPKHVLSAETYKYWAVDNLRGTLTIVLQDGRTVSEPMPPELRPARSRISSTIFDWERWWIHSFTEFGDWIIAEGFNPTALPAFHGRPAVYLDQNRWRTVADALVEPERIEDADERSAARRIVYLASDDGIVLPLSTGHMVETAGLHSQRRYEVGVAMAKLSGGWQIRNPLDVWRHEATTTMAQRLGTMSEGASFHPITTEPGALFGSDTSLGLSPRAEDHEIFLAMLTMPNTVLDVLVNPEAMAKDPLANWVDHHARITSQFHELAGSKHQRRGTARRRFWNENINYYTAAHRRLVDRGHFPMFSDRELETLLAASPMVGLLSELFIRRFIDHKVKWRRNDLIDMLHLSSAAGYADYVAAERHTGTQLRAAQQSLGRDVTVHASLSELVGALDRDGVKGAKERSPLPSSS